LPPVGANYHCVINEYAMEDTSRHAWREMWAKGGKLPA
jgi:hypothetical protein